MSYERLIEMDKSLTFNHRILRFIHYLYILKIRSKQLHTYENPAKTLMKLFDF